MSALQQVNNWKNKAILLWIATGISKRSVVYIVQANSLHQKASKKKLKSRYQLPGEATSDATLNQMALQS